MMYCCDDYFGCHLDTPWKRVSTEEPPEACWPVCMPVGAFLLLLLIDVGGLSTPWAGPSPEDGLNCAKG